MFNFFAFRTEDQKKERKEETLHELQEFIPSK